MDYTINIAENNGPNPYATDGIRFVHYCRVKVCGEVAAKQVFAAMTAKFPYPAYQVTIRGVVTSYNTVEWGKDRE